MNGARISKPRNPEKTFPRCLGRMVNLLDLNTSLAGNRFITEKPHHDDDFLCRSFSGPSLSVGRSDAIRMSPIIDPAEDKEIVSELRRSSSNKKSNLTPMKMLIEQEMSKEVESKRNPPCVVARLMGLDALPQQRPDSAVQRSYPRGYSQSHLGIPLDYWPQEDELVMHMQREISHSHSQSENDYKDVYEIRQESEKGCYARESPQKGWGSESINEKKMNLGRQKFTEAKRLSADEKLRRSKEFHDAVEVLSSNKDFFLKFLQEPNSLFSQHLLSDFQSLAPPLETKRITVLRPSKVVDNKKNSGQGKKDEKPIKRASGVDQLIGWDKRGPGCPPNLQVNDNPTPPTRIVVLKPTPGKPHDIKGVVSPPPSSPGVLHSQELYGEREYETQESGEEAKETTWPICENLSGHRRDETLLSSVFSNDCIGYESSFNKSENEYAVGNNDEIEVISPTCRHSWDYINSYANRYSPSSFSRPSCSQESSVSREAKRRLSERWAMMALNGTVQEKRHARRSSGTLGEMLALSETKSFVRSEKEGMNKEQEPSGSQSSSTSGLNKNENVYNSPRNLLRSKSLPISSTLFGRRLNGEVSDPEVGRSDAKEVTKQQNVKSSLKEKVSSLFFSRNKNSSKEKSSASQSKGESKKSAGMVVNATENICDVTSQCASDTGIEEGSLQLFRGSSSKASFPNVVGVGPKLAKISPEAGLYLIKPKVSGHPCENQDQPSPVSILEPPFLEDDSVKLEPYNINADKHGAKLSAHSIRSNLIDKSPPIGSIARTLSWDDSCVETATSYQPQPSLVSQEPEVEEQEWLFHIQSLLSAAGLDGEVQSDSFFSRWHSPESILDPSLRGKYTDLNNEEIIHEAKRRKMRSTRKLVFDCVNAALVDISSYGSRTSVGIHNRVLEGPSPTLVDQVREWMKEWLPSEVRCFLGVGGDTHGLVVDGAVRKDVVGKEWVELRSLEIDNIGKEIERVLVEELVQEAVVGLIGRVC